MNFLFSKVSKEVWHSYIYDKWNATPMARNYFYFLCSILLHPPGRKCLFCTPNEGGINNYTLIICNDVLRTYADLLRPTLNFYASKKASQKFGVKRKQFGVGHEPVYKIDPWTNRFQGQDRNGF